MKKIYSLETNHADDPTLVELTQKLTLDKDRPMMGLAGNYGLYGSPEWWENLYSGVIPLHVYEGVIDDIHFSGMNNESKSFTLLLDSGGKYKYTCVVNRKKNMKHYQIGHRFKVTVFTEKMKNGSDQEFVWKIEVENA
jgi:hypothetical protein